jgi:hypothetical protein
MATNEKALAAFIGEIAQIDFLLENMKALADDHFGATPEEIDWGHVGDAARLAAKLKEALEPYGLPLEPPTT